jgi:hypothetical protein
VWVSQYSVALIRLGSMAEMWTWQSTKPGITVAFDKSMISAPAGDTKPDSMDRILSSRTRIETCRRGVSATASIRVPAWMTRSLAWPAPAINKTRPMVKHSARVRFIESRPLLAKTIENYFSARAAERSMANAA